MWSLVVASLPRRCLCLVVLSGHQPTSQTSQGAFTVAVLLYSRQSMSEYLNTCRKSLPRSNFDVLFLFLFHGPRRERVENFDSGISSTPYSCHTSRVRIIMGPKHILLTLAGRRNFSSDGSSRKLEKKIMTVRSRAILQWPRLLDLVSPVESKRVCGLFAR